MIEKKDSFRDGMKKADKSEDTKVIEQILNEVGNYLVQFVM